jgi:histone deacetylase 11
MRIVYSRQYNITFFGIEHLHPFDSQKYGRAWDVLRKECGPVLAKYHQTVDRPASDEELLMVHTSEYLQTLRSSLAIAAALEMPQLAVLPASILQWRILRPMRWAVRGSVLAGRAALQSGLAVNLSGGYHHAKPGKGEGFCLFSDAALIIRQLRADGQLGATAPVAYIDLDAHQGNGVCHECRDDPSVRIFDMYNRDIYPRGDLVARQRIDCNVPLEFNTTGAHYLRLLRSRLPAFLDESSCADPPRLAIYNAGTDPYAYDQLGGMCLSAADILERDLFVIDQLQSRRIPVVMLLSGGYSKESFQLVAATIRKLLQRCKD